MNELDDGANSRANVSMLARSQGNLATMTVSENMAPESGRMSRATRQTMDSALLLSAVGVCMCVFVAIAILNRDGLCTMS